MTSLFICDLDGTLVDSFADIRRSIADALAVIDVEPTSELLDLCRRGIGLELFYLRATGRSPDGADFERFVAEYRRSYFHAQGQSRAYEGVGETLAEIRRRHPDLICAIATTKRTDMARRVVDSCGLAEFFELVRGSDGLPHKPDPAILEDIAQHCDRELCAAVMVGDTDRDVLAAKAAGIISVAVTYGGWTRDELAAIEPDHMIDRFGEVLSLLSPRAASR